jgi:predicted metal-dependent HD superfamily phosphohydrolase
MIANPVRASLDLPACWRAAWREIGLACVDPLLGTALIQRYQEPHRRYHTLQHIEECLVQFEQVRDLAGHPGEIQMAIWFHDAIYDTGRHDNEQRCADWARQVILASGGEYAVAERVHRLILATRHDVMPATPDEQLLVDIDLSILGQDAARFDEYEVQIREEYRWVVAFLFRQKRCEVLKKFLGRERLFATQRLYDALEDRARENLRHAIDDLKA